eukprot:scaffold28071_cov67-Phaeocystis_antarctica.AAC.2
MEGDALMYKRALKMRRYGLGLEVWAGWGGGGNRATGEGQDVSRKRHRRRVAAAAHLRHLFLDSCHSHFLLRRLLHRHRLLLRRKPHALPLRRASGEGQGGECVENNKSHLFECGSQGPAAAEARATVAPEAVKKRWRRVSATVVRANTQWWR